MAVRGIRLVEWVAVPAELRGVTLVYGAAGAGKTALMLMAAKALKGWGRKVAYIDVAGGAPSISRYGIETIDVELNVTHLLYTLRKLVAEGYDAIFIHRPDVFEELVGKDAFVRALKVMAGIARAGLAVVISLAKTEGIDPLFGAVIHVGENFIEAMRSPTGRIRISKAECKL